MNNTSFVGDLACLSSRGRQRLLARLSILTICIPLIYCGRGSSGGPQSDFSISTQPATLVIAPGGTQSIQISATGKNGLTGNVQVNATPPSGITVSPSSFSVTPGTPVPVTISAAANLSPGTATISFTGSSGSVSHTVQMATIIELAGTSPHPPFRSRYLRTDLQYNSAALQAFPPHLTVYDGVHKHFFMSNWALNRIDVFDGASESPIGSIILPFPWGIDITPDGKTMYAATMFGDIYLIDPVGLKVQHRYPSATIGPKGYAPIEPFILASGQLALLAGLPQFNLDGSPTFAIWNPTTNNLQVIYPDIFSKLSFPSIGQMTLTADRSKIVLGNADGGDLVVYDPTTSTWITGETVGISWILTTPDGSRIITGNEGGQFEVFDANTLAELGSFKTSSIYDSVGAILSPDGSTLFSNDLIGNVTAYSLSTFSQTGWVPNFDVVDFPNSIILSAIDDTGLAVGPIGHGVAFLDTSQIKGGLSQTIFAIDFSVPGTGTPSGGTAVQAKVSEENASCCETINSGTLYVGNAVADNVSVSLTQTSGLTPPASTPGPADFTLVLPDGSFQLNPEDFSYGPTIVELSTNATSADGGSQGVIFGYGLGQQASDLTVTVGGQPAQVTQVIPSVSPIFPYPFPMAAAVFTIPAGTSGTQATVTATTVAGSVNSATPLTYVPVVQTFESPNGALMQGLYDPRRGVVYFTDQSQIDVFSISANNWVAPITISYATGNSRLMGIALSPDGNTLAISDAAQGNIYVLNPSSPTNVKSFNVLNGGELQPYALAVSSSGFVYYDTFDVGIVPPGAFHKLDTNTGKITNYQLTGESSFDRLLLNPQGTSVYGSGPFILDTATDSIRIAIQTSNAGDGNIDMALSGDGTTLITEDLLTDANLNAEGDITYVDRDVWLPLAVYGQKLNTDASLIFQPINTGIDVHDGTTGLLLYRVALPIELADAYDALAIDNNDGLLFAITPTGMAEVNLSSLPAVASRQHRHLHRRTLPLREESIMRTPAANKEKRKHLFPRPQLRHLTRLQ